MSVEPELRRVELVALRERLLTAAHDIVNGDEQQGELNSAAGDQHLADHASDMVDRELDGSLEEGNLGPPQGEGIFSRVRRAFG